MNIGITGVFGSGKSTVAKLFTNYKYVNSDSIGHKLLGKTSVKNKIVKIFGKKILTSGKIDRRKLKNIVFYDYKSLVKLNKIIHPPIIKEIKKIISKNKGKNVIVEGALLIEVKCLGIFDKLIVVKVTKKEQMKRALARKKYDKTEIESIVKSQLSQKEKLKYADYIVDNSKGINNTKKQVKKIIEKLK